jgi:hypothetical protein
MNTLIHEARMTTRRLSIKLAEAEANTRDIWGCIDPAKAAHAHRIRKTWERSADRWRRRNGHKQIYK